MNRPVNRKASSELSLRRQVKGIDGRTGSLPFFIEQRGQDNKRIGQLQRETA